MKKSNLQYNVINIIFLISSILFVNYFGIFDMKFSFVELIILIILFLVLHVLKFIRIYFILLEEKIPLGRIIKIYIRTI